MKQPDLVFIFMDDMGWTDLACTGSNFYETPNLDRLCAEGLRFPAAYAACPVCSPSRASYLTGKYPARVGVTDWIDMSGRSHPLRGRLIDAPYAKRLPDGEVSLAQALREGGYRTWHVGKWHLGDRAHWPERYGYDVNVGGTDWGHPHQGYFSPYGIETLPDGPEGEYLTDRLTDEAVRLIEGADERPFFLSLCHYAVHTPIQAKPEDVERFRRKAARLGLDRLPVLEEGEAFHTEDKRGRRVMRRRLQSDPAYAAMMWNLDQNIGRLCDALSRAGRLDNTLLIFTSDNGGLATAEGSPTCNAPAAEGKGWLYEGGCRVPLIARWPGRIAPGVCETPVTTPDFYPTLLEAAGLPPRPAQHVDGVSLLPLFAGRTLPERPLFWHYPHYGNQGGTPGAAVRLGPWKLIELFEDGRTELYNVVDDISESRERSAEFPDIAADLLARLHAWQTQTGARFPAENPTPYIPE